MEIYIRTELYPPLSGEEVQYFSGLHLTLYECYRLEVSHNLKHVRFVCIH